MSKLAVIASKTKHPKCPRCYRHKPEGHSNFARMSAALVWLTQSFHDQDGL